LSQAAAQAVTEADELVVASITWFELAWLAQRERIVLSIPIRTWLDGLASEVRTLGITPVIAATAVSLPTSFPGDPADRLIYVLLVTKDERMRSHRHPRRIAVW
jgi:PIN domain nuclease of toxin-antitoxin system